METSMRFSRRTFVAWAGGAGAGLLPVRTASRDERAEALAQIPGGSLDPKLIPKLHDADADPAGDAQGRHDHATRRQARRLLRDLDEADHQQILPAGHAGDDGLGLRRGHGAEQARAARSTTPRRSRSRRNGSGRSGSSGSTSSRTRTGTSCPTCCRSTRRCTGRTRPAATMGRDMRPTFTETPGPYTGPVPIVTHVHGAVGVADDSDGYAEAWYLPDASNPEGFATEGRGTSSSARRRRRLRRRLGARLRRLPVPEPQPGLDDLVPRPRARHDPPERLRGPGRLLPIRGGPTTSCSTRGPGSRGALPGPAPRENDKFPPNKPYREIPIAIQDRAFNADG